MKKFWVILLSLGLIMAFAMPAAAVDVKVYGSYYASGFIVDNPSALDKGQAGNTTGAGATMANSTTSSWLNNPYRGPDSWYDQRLRIYTEFQIVEGLKLVTRFDALEKRWGDQSWGGLGDAQVRNQTPAGTNGAAVNARQNIEVDQAYLDFNVPFGKFQAGYMPVAIWGTDFMDVPLMSPGIRYFFTQGPLQVVAAVEKRAEYTGNTAASIGRANDSDKDVYDLGVTFKFAPGEAGLLYQYLRNGQNKWEQANGNLAQLNFFSPYAKLTFGPVYIEAEGLLATGTLRAYESTTAVGSAPTPVAGSPYATSSAQNVNLTSWGAYINAKVDFKPVYFGGQFVYISGDDNSNADKVTGSINPINYGNYGFNRSLILWNAEYGDNLGAMYGNMGTAPGSTATAAQKLEFSNRRTAANYAVNQFMDNVWFYQAYVGIRPMPKMDLKASFSFAKADKAPKSDVGAIGSAGYYSGAAVKQFVSDDYGYELDVTGTYKIYANLTYMMGAGYLWTGDYFKGYDSNAQVKNNYLLTHKLILNF